MKKSDVVRLILKDRFHKNPKNGSGKAFAPTNIALCKYWGKRNTEINLPVTSSLSISLGNKGATTELTVIEQQHDVMIVNDQPMDFTTSFGKRLVNFLDLFRERHAPHFKIDIQSTIPIAAGMASSACGFAALIMALNHMYGWKLAEHELSILARLGSGSACRSIWQGFVEWHAGIREDGMDCFGVQLPMTWPELCIGLLVVSEKEKSLSSREAMERTVNTSALYSSWPAKVNIDLDTLKHAIQQQNFEQLGKTAESNAMTMHATMLSAWPPVTYFLPETLVAMQKIWQLRHEGLQIYFTQDAGPNLKLLFLQNDKETVKSYFPNVDIVQPFFIRA